MALQSTFSANQLWDLHLYYCGWCECYFVKTGWWNRQHMDCRWEALLCWEGPYYAAFLIGGQKAVEVLPAYRGE